MREKDVQAPSGKQAFRRGLLRENPVLMQCIGLFPAIVLATSLKSAAIVAVASAVLLIVMEFLTALLLKKLPFWLRIGMYALLSFGILAGGLAACEKLVPNLLGSMSSYLLLLAVNALIVFRCETCAAHQSVRISLLDALGASLGYAAVLVLLGFFRELLGSGAVLGHVFPALPQITGMLMPFGGFLVLGFMAAAVKWLYDIRHRGEDELKTPVAHVEEDDGSVMEPLIRLFRKERGVAQGASAPQAEKRPEKQPHTEKAETAEPSARKAAEQQARQAKRQALEQKRAEQKAAEQQALAQKRMEQQAKRQASQKKQQAPEQQKPAEQKAAEKQTREDGRQHSEGKQRTPEKKKQASRPKRQPPEKKREPAAGRHSDPPAALSSTPAGRDDEMESFADVLAALNRRRAEQERKAQGTDENQAEKGERRP